MTLISRERRRNQKKVRLAKIAFWVVIQQQRQQRQQQPQQRRKMDESLETSVAETATL